MKRNQDLGRSTKRGWLAILVVAGWFPVAAVVTPAERETLAPEKFFSQTVYPFLEKAQCRLCHVENGVASATRVRFPDPEASGEEVEAFGLGLAVLVDRVSPEDSLLLNKPTNRVAHTGGERIRKGSEEEKDLLRWIDFLSRVSDAEIAAAEPGREAAVLPETPMRRLTHSQYNNTVRDLLGDQSFIANRFPPEAYVNGFKNQAVAQSISPLLAEMYSQAAETLARNAHRFGELEKRLPCRPSSVRDGHCRDWFIRHFGLRAFRQPLSERDVERYSEIFDAAATQSGNFLQGAQMVVEAMLQSPKFLFHRQAPPEKKGYERASRLSYFLWNTMPDERLLHKAASAELATLEGVQETAREMLEGPRARSALDEFFAQWLRFDSTLTTFKDGRLFPEFTPDLAALMVEETKSLLAHLVWNDQNFMEAFTAEYGFINAELAGLYGFPPPQSDFELVSFPRNTRRAGLLGQGTFLAGTSKPGDTSPTARGIFVREQFLCQHVPSPPPDVNTSLPEPTPVRPQTNRERLEEHAENPACASCHRLMDPIGLGLENFDAIGRWRDRHVLTFGGRRRGEKVRTVELEMDTSGIVAGLSGPDSSTPPQFSGAEELGRLLAESEICQECIVRQLFRYALGRLEKPADRETIRHAASAFRRSGFRFKELLVALVQSPQFLGETGQEREKTMTGEDEE